MNGFVYLLALFHHLEKQAESHVTVTTGCEN